MVEVPSFIHGQKIITARGYVVPVQDIPRITPVNAKHFIGKVDFCPNLSTTEKGNKAVSVVMQLLKFGWFPLPWDSGLVDGQGGDTDTNAAIAGALLGAVHGREAVPAQWADRVLNCRPKAGDPRVQRPRPERFWPVDALELAAQLVGG